MKINGLLHINIRCSATDLPEVVRFYAEVLDMKTGYRPPFTTPGAWLYLGDDPLIHVSARYPEGSVVKSEKHNGSVDHVAFSCENAAEFRARLVRRGVAFEERNVENAGFQIFFLDPTGTRLEFNFPNSEAPQQ